MGCDCASKTEDVARKTHALGMRLGGKFTGSYPFCSNFQHQIRELALPVLLIFGKKTGVRGGIVKARMAAIDIRKASDIAFRGKVMLGFAVVLAITVASMGIAYLGFERVSTGVTSYRNSVSEADLARNIDRELISYQVLARYYVVTGKEDDAQAALTAETALKDAIDQSMRVPRIRRVSNRSPASPGNSGSSPRFLPTSSGSSARAR
jgi:hypothetical protein